MPPIRPEDHAYRFRPAVLRELRGQLNLTQAQMAGLLEIPVNTLSRWELGSNLPDANALAAVYSVAAERGIRPQFFEERSAMNKRKTRKDRIIDWDFQNLGVEAENIEDTIEELIEYMDCVYGRSGNDALRVYVSPWGINFSQSQTLRQAEFEVVQCYSNADRKIMEDGESLFSSSSDFHPKESAYVLISDDGDYADYLKGFRTLGVETFVVGTDECSQKLIRAVGQDHFIPLNRPYVVLKCLEVAQELNGKTIHKGNFGDLCRRKLSDDGLELDDIDGIMEDTGFSLNRPYASALLHMEFTGLVKTHKADNDPNRITITITIPNL